jgi:hypothetical protein
MTQERGKFLFSLVRYARPIAEKAGDVAPCGTGIATDKTDGGITEMKDSILAASCF